MDDAEIKKRLEELRGQRIELDKRAEQAPSPQERLKVNIARGTFEGGERQQAQPPLSQQPAPQEVNIARGIEKEKAAANNAMQQPAATQQAAQPLPKKLALLPPPPLPPYTKPPQKPEAPPRHALYAQRREEPKEKGEEEEMAEELMPVVKKIVAYAPAGQAAKHEQAPQAIAQAHGQMAAAAQAPAKPLTRREQRRLERDNAGPATAPAQATTQQAAKEITFEDLLGPAGQQAASANATEAPAAEEGKSQQPAEAAEGKSLFAELEQVSGGPAGRKESVTQVQVKKDEPLACPTCKAQNTRVVFCPYCGTGMCANCSPAIRPENDFFIFTCPHCSEEVTVKKKMPQSPIA